MLAGHGYMSSRSPRFTTSFCPRARCSTYDQAGSDTGNELKTAKDRQQPTTATRVPCSTTLRRAPTAPDASARWASASEGTWRFARAMNADVLGTVCFYATDIHKGSLGKGMADDSLARTADVKGELFMAWGRQDPHVPTEGRMKILVSPERGWNQL